MLIVSHIGRFVRGLLRSEAGNIAVVTGLMLPALIGFCGLGIETGYWYFRERDVQAAADIAAYSGTVALRGGATLDTVVSVATAQAKSNGWQSASGTIKVNTPPTSGPNQNNNSVEVLLTENENRYFTAIYSSQKVATNVRAVATYISAGPACMLALDKSASGAMTFWGNAYADFTNCNVVSNSDRKSTRLNSSH